MSKLTRFLLLSSTERWLLTSTALLTISIKLSLRFLPFLTVHRLFSSHTAANVTPHPSPHIVATSTVDQWVWAINAVGRHLPGMTCLVQAYALHFVLARCGIRTRLQIGILRSRHGQIEAHAWVEHQGAILIGNLPNLVEYTRLPTLRQAAP
ncbi:MAG: lasso peptide biosynthesis B2 protein [Caldilineaceae bacterium]